MTQPPQWGAPPPPVRQPTVLNLVALLHWAFAEGTFVLAALALVSVAMTGDQVVTGILLALVWATLGLLNVPAVLSLDHASTGLSRLASLVTALVFGGALVRSAVVGAAGPFEWTVIVAMLVVCLLNVFLTTLPRR